MGEGLGGWGARHPALRWKLAKGVSVQGPTYFLPPRRPRVSRAWNGGSAIPGRSTCLPSGNSTYRLWMRRWLLAQLKVSALSGQEHAWRRADRSLRCVRRDVRDRLFAFRSAAKPTALNVASRKTEPVKHSCRWLRGCAEEEAPMGCGDCVLREGILIVHIASDLQQQVPDCKEVHHKPECG